MEGKEIEKVKYELDLMRACILELAKKIKVSANEIEGRLDNVIRLADQVNENVEESIHFPLNPQHHSNWESIINDIVEVDTRIKAYRQMKKIYELMKRG